MQVKLRIAGSSLLVVIMLLSRLASPGLAQQGTLVATFGPVVGGPQMTMTPLVQPTEPPTEPPAATPTETVAVTPTATIPPLPTLRRDLMGVQVYAYLPVDQWRLLTDYADFMGFRWIKFQVSWKEIEADGKGQFRDKFKVLAEHVDYVGRRGFKTLLSIANAPDWARPAEARGQQDGPPANPQDLADFVAALLDGWGTTYIHAVEIWNEPNLQREWTGAPMTPTSYKRYFDVAYNTIRARSPGITVMPAGLAPTGDGPASVDDRVYLDGMYKAGLPLGDPNFVIAAHPYGWSNPPDARCCPAEKKGWDDQKYFFFLDTISEYRQIMLANNHGDGKLWVTEFGYSAFDGLQFKSNIDGPPAMPPNDPGLAWMNRLTEAQQAEYIIRSFELAQTGDLAGFLGPMMLWNLNFSTLPDFLTADRPSRPEAGFSLIDSDWAPRPIYNWLQAAPKQ